MNHPLTRTLIIVLSMTILIFLPAHSTGETLDHQNTVRGPGAPVDTLPPVILTENNDNKILKLWSSPTPDASAVYDQWEIFIFSTINASYTVIINDGIIFQGTALDNVTVLYLDATAYFNIRVNITIDNRSYHWGNLLINHQEISWGGSPGGSTGGQYTEDDIKWTRFVSGLGVLLSSIAMMPLVWLGVKWYRNRQGVVRW